MASEQYTVQQALNKLATDGIKVEAGEIEIGKVVIKDDVDAYTANVDVDGALAVKAVNVPIGYDAPDDSWRYKPFKTKITPLDGEKDVTTGGTAEPLMASETLVQKVLIQAKPGNTNNVYVGGSGISSSTGVLLTAGESMPIEAGPDEILDLNEHYIDVDTDGEGVTFTYWS